MNCKGWGACCRAPRPSVCDERSNTTPSTNTTLGGQSSQQHTHTPTATLHLLNHCTSPPHSTTRSQQSVVGQHTHTHIHNTPTSTTPALLVLPHASGALVHCCCCCCCCWRRCITALWNAVSRGPSCAWACRQDQNPGRGGVATPSPVGQVAHAVVPSSRESKKSTSSAVESAL